MTTPTTPAPRRPAARRGRVLRSVLALLVGASLLAACGGGSEDAQGDLDKVTFLNILPLESLTFAPEMIADTNGFFAKHGLQVNFEATQGSAPAIQTVLAGSAPITRIGDIETILAAAERGAPLVNIGTVQHDGPIRFASSKREPITTAEDFRGKTIGLPSEGGTSEITLDLILGSAGIPPQDVPRQVVGLAPGVFNLVQADRIDAYAVSLDTSVVLQQSRPDAVIYDPNDDIDSGAQLYATSKQQAQDPETRDLLRRYLLAIRDAIQFMADDADNGFAETMRLINSEYKVPALENPDVGREALRSYLKSWTARDAILTTSPEQWKATYQEIVRAGLVPPGRDPAQWMTNELAPAAS